MPEYDAATYGDRIADIYDEWVARVSFVSNATDDAVAALADLARGGPALELGIGTGRIALPLAGREVEVHGIDASEAMIARLRAKPGSAEVTVSIGDFAEVAVAGTYQLVYVVFNTFFGLLSQEQQVRCFANVVRHLTPDGLFVIEAFVPDPTRFDRGQRVSTFRVELDRVIVDVAQHDPVAQRVDSQHVIITEQGIRLLPTMIRYAWPSELDLMARLAGLRLRERWGGWRREPFTAASPSHVSIYERA